MVPFATFCNFEFLHDNAQPHIAKVNTKYLADVGIKQIEWHPRCTELNPIEHVWDIVKRQVRARISAPVRLFLLLRKNFKDQAITNLIETTYGSYNMKAQRQ